MPTFGAPFPRMERSRRGILREKAENIALRWARSPPWVHCLSFIEARRGALDVSGPAGFHSARAIAGNRQYRN
jgi:hypothetical protein